MINSFSVLSELVSVHTCKPPSQISCRLELAAESAAGRGGLVGLRSADRTQPFTHVRLSPGLHVTQPCQRRPLACPQHPGFPIPWQKSADYTEEIRT